MLLQPSIGHLNLRNDALINMRQAFRPMRRIRQQLSRQEAQEILRSATAGVLSVNGDNGYPYAVPVSYVYTDGTIYFHSALQGHKIDAIRDNPKVSFCVIAEDDVKPREFTTYFKSVIAFGKARIIEDADEKMAALRLLAERYSDNTVTRTMTDIEIAGGFNRLLMVAIQVEHLSGKESIELVRQRHL